MLPSTRKMAQKSMRRCDVDHISDECAVFYSRPKSARCDMGGAALWPCAALRAEVSAARRIETINP
jgi:hypothetical protein